jgi:hypothetical protein
MKFEATKQDNSKLLSEDLIEFNFKIKSLNLKSIKVFFDNNFIELNLINYSLLKNSEVLFDGLSDEQIKSNQPLQVKLFRRKYVVIGQPNANVVSDKYFLGFIGLDVEKYVVSEGINFNIVDSK